MDTHTLEPAHGLWLAASICRLLGLPLDHGLAERQSPPPWTLATLRGLLAELGLKTGYVTPRQGIQDLTLPAVGFLQKAEREDHAAPILIVRADAERLLYFQAGSDTPENRPLLRHHLRQPRPRPPRRRARRHHPGRQMNGPAFTTPSKPSRRPTLDVRFTSRQWAVV